MFLTIENYWTVFPNSWITILNSSFPHADLAFLYVQLIKTFAAAMGLILKTQLVHNFREKMQKSER